MGAEFRKVEYFHCTARDRPGEAYSLLSRLATAGVNLLAFSAIPIGAESTQLTMFPEDPDELASFAQSSGMVLQGPQHAFLIQADDRLGALAELHRRLADERINVYASSGVSDGKGTFGYLVYVRSEEFERAAAALGL